jgi:hypothetical protein
MSRGIVWGIAAGSLVIAAYLYWVNQGKPSYAAVGDCVTTPRAGQVARIGCGDAGALKVLAKFPGDDSNRCDAVSSTARVFVEYPKGASAFVLCVGNAK